MSEFSQALKDLFDKTEVFDHNEWAKYLGTKEQAIEDWIADIAIPPPHHLAMIRTLFDHISSAGKEAIASFDAMAKKKSTLVSPLGKLMFPNVAEYYRRPVFNELSSRLAKMNNEQRAKYLINLYGE